MNNRNDLRHEGIVKSVNVDEVTVEIPVSSACAQCHARAVCGSDIGEARIIPVKRKDDGSLKPGDKVVISITRDMGFKAVLLAYVIPLIILLLLLLTLPQFLQNELVTGLVCIGVLAVYYGVLALCRRKIDSGFKFNIVAKI